MSALRVIPLVGILEYDMSRSYLHYLTGTFFVLQTESYSIMICLDLLYTATESYGHGLFFTMWPSTTLFRTRCVIYLVGTACS